MQTRIERQFGKGRLINEYGWWVRELTEDLKLNLYQVDLNGVDCTKLEPGELVTFELFGCADLRIKKVRIKK